MNFYELLKIEFKKIKRSKLIPLISIAPLLVVSSGVASLHDYLTPEYTNAWAAMFIQSALVYSYYLLPFSTTIVCVLIAGRETQHNGILKMLTLPIGRHSLSIAKFCVLLFCLLMEVMLFLIVFVIAGLIAANHTGITEILPVWYLLSWCIKLFLSMLPGAAVMWTVTILLHKPLLSAGLNLLFIIPSVLVANTPLWIAYPYCYSGYLVSCSLHDFTAGGASRQFELFPFLPCAVFIFVLGISITALKSYKISS